MTIDGDLTTAVVSVRDVYQRDVTIPDGWEYSGFRIPVLGEWVVVIWSGVACVFSGVEVGAPRIIVKRKGGAE